MKPSELRQLTDEELAARVRELRDNLFNVNIKHSTGQLEDSAGVKNARRQLARALTIEAQRSRAQ